MVSIKQTVIGFKSFFGELQQEVKAWVARRMEEQLDSEVDDWLHRGRYERRWQVGGQQTTSECSRCGTRAVRHFSRNGHRKRQVVSTYGVLDIQLPRVVCDCGGSVPIPFSMLTPYQRLWDDVLEQVGRWADLGLSLRQMQTEIGEQQHTQVGLHVLNEVVQDVRPSTEQSLSSVPPIVLLDAIWLTLLEGTATARDQAARQGVRVGGRGTVSAIRTVGHSRLCLGE
jgi:hypothetical protein